MFPIAKTKEMSANRYFPERVYRSHRSTNVWPYLTIRILQILPCIDIEKILVWESMAIPLSHTHIYVSEIGVTGHDI